VAQDSQRRALHAAGDPAFPRPVGDWTQHQCPVDVLKNLRPENWPAVSAALARRRAASTLAGDGPGLSSRPDQHPGERPGLAGAAGARGPGGDLVSELFHAYAVGLVRLAVMLVGDQPSAEDIVQEAFLGLYRALPRLRDTAAALPYLRTAVVNGSRTVLRARRRARLRGAQHDPPVWSAEAAVMAGEDRRAVLTAVAALPRRAREVLALRYYLDLTDHEIAALLRVSRGTVSSTASRALAALARELKEEL
jgi:RNA polymerase sigma factor (sigma-70 family)